MVAEVRQRRVISHDMLYKEKAVFQSNMGLAHYRSSYTICGVKAFYTIEYLNSYEAYQMKW